MPYVPRGLNSFIANCDAVQNLAAHHDYRGTMHDPPEQVAARHPNDAAIRPVADKSDDKTPDAAPDTPWAVGNTQAANNKAAAVVGISPVPVRKPADNLQPAVYSKSAAVVQRPVPA